MDKLRLSFYKPNKEETKGSAVQFELTPRGVMIEMAAQKGEKLPPRTKGKQFGWEDKLRLLLMQLELAKIVRRIRLDVVDELQFYHDTETKTATLKLGFSDRGLSLRIGIKEKKDGSNLQAIQVLLDKDEAFLLAKFLEEAIVRSFGGTDTNVSSN